MRLLSRLAAGTLSCAIAASRVWLCAKMRKLSLVPPAEARAWRPIREDAPLKSRLLATLACGALALITLAAASPTPGTSESPTPGTSASPTPGTSASPTPGTSKSPTATSTPAPLGYSIQVERGSVLHLQSTAVCPAVPKSTKGSKRIVVNARIIGPTDKTGSVTASGTGVADAKRAWQLDVSVPADAKLGKATLVLTCSTGTPAAVYYKYSTTSVMIIDPVAAEKGPNWPQLLVLSLIAGLVLGMGGLWLAARGLPLLRTKFASSGSVDSASQDGSAEVAPDGGQGGALDPEVGGSDQKEPPVG